MPSERTVWRWARAYPEFEAALREARRVGAGAMADELVERVRELAERGRRGELEKGEVAAAKLESETVRWFLSRWGPDQFGDRVSQPGVRIIINSTLALAGEPAADPATDGGPYRVVVEAQPSDEPAD